MTVRATVPNLAARAAAPETRESVGHHFFALPTAPARPPSTEPIIFQGQREGRGRRNAGGVWFVLEKTQTRHGIDRRWQRELRAILHKKFFQSLKATERVG